MKERGRAAAAGVRQHESRGVVFRPLTEHPPGPPPVEMQARALRSAIILRDCSLRTQSNEVERRACRTLMRGQAMRWRHPGATEC